MTLSIRLIKTPHDGYVFGLCKAGSWRPLMLFCGWAKAREACV